MARACLTDHPLGTLLQVRVTPNAARSAAVGVVAGADGRERLAVKVKAPPVEGQANRAAREWAAEAFGLRPARVALEKGDRSREKTLLLEGLPLAEAAAILDRLLAPIEGDPNHEE